MLDALHIAVFALDDNGRMVYANPAFAQRLGRKADTLADADIHALLAPNADWKQPTGLSETEAQSIEFRAAKGTVCMTMHRQKLADKPPLWLFQETTAHNQKPAESGDYHQMVLSAIPDQLFVLDETGCITGFHSPTDVLTDGAGLSLTGKHFRHFLPEEMGIIVQKHSRMHCNTAHQKHKCTGCCPTATNNGFLYRSNSMPIRPDTATLPC